MQKKLVNKLVKECSEKIYNGTLNYYEKVCNSCTVYIVLFVVVFLRIMFNKLMFQI